MRARIPVLRWCVIATGTADATGGIATIAATGMVAATGVTARRLDGAGIPRGRGITGRAAARCSGPCGSVLSSSSVVQG
jgi:hypothetical protein